MSVDSSLTPLLMSISSIFKWVTISFSLLYFGYSLIVIQQINLMFGAVVTQFSSIIRALGYLHLAVTLLLIGLLIIYL